MSAATAACIFCTSLAVGVCALSAEFPRLSYDVLAEAAVQDLNPEYCWFHPRTAAIPGAGKDGKPVVIMTLLKHLAADDHYSGLYVSRTDDLGQTWSAPVAVPELAWRNAADAITVAVIDPTPGWHAASGKLLVIGAKILYSESGDYAGLAKQPRSYETSYATFDVASNRWSGWRELELPDTENKFYRAGCGASQWLIEPDGTLLVPIHFQPKQGGDYQATVLHCSLTVPRCAIWVTVRNCRSKADAVSQNHQSRNSRGSIT